MAGRGLNTVWADQVLISFSVLKARARTVLGGTREPAGADSTLEFRDKGG